MMLRTRILPGVMLLMFVMFASGCGGAGGGDDSGGSYSQSSSAVDDDPPLALVGVSSGYLLEAEVTPPLPESFDVAVFSSPVSYSPQPTPDSFGGGSSVQTHTNPEPTTVVMVLTGIFSFVAYVKFRRFQ